MVALLASSVIFAVAGVCIAIAAGMLHKDEHAKGRDISLFLSLAAISGALLAAYRAGALQ